MMGHEDYADLIEEMNIDLRHRGDSRGIAIYEMQPIRQGDGYGVLKALVSYDADTESLAELKGQSCYAGCIFEEMMLSDILKIACYQQAKQN